MSVFKVKAKGSFLSKGFEILQEMQVFAVLIGGAEVNELVGKFFIDSSLVQHVHHEVIQILERE